MYLMNEEVSITFYSPLTQVKVKVAKKAVRTTPGRRL
jgi:hypothetical protein